MRAGSGHASVSRSALRLIRTVAACTTTALLVGCTSTVEAPTWEVFVCTPSTGLMLSARSGFKPIREIPNGEEMTALSEKDEWLKVRTRRDEEGWVLKAETAPLEVLDRSRRMAEEAAKAQVQYRGALNGDANLRMEPDKNAPFPRRLSKGDTVYILDHSRANGSFLKVRSAEGHAGWVAGWLVEPRICPELEPYQEDRALGACIELNRITGEDGEHPQLLLADAKPTSIDVDFDRIRMFTWNLRKSRYETAYVEREMRGVLPITFETEEDGAIHVRIEQIREGGERRPSWYTFKGVYFRKDKGSR
ncbi:MAG: SH3 domain-containing protein [Acidobacteriota bacterium]